MPAEVSFPGGCGGLPGAGNAIGVEVAEGLLRPQQPRVDERHQRVELAEFVLQGRPGDDDPPVASDPRQGVNDLRWGRRRAALSISPQRIPSPTHQASIRQDRNIPSTHSKPNLSSAPSIRSPPGPSAPPEPQKAQRCWYPQASSAPDSPPPTHLTRSSGQSGTPRPQAQSSEGNQLIAAVGTQHPTPNTQHPAPNTPTCAYTRETPSARGIPGPSSTGLAQLNTHNPQCKPHNPTPTAQPPPSVAGP